MKFLNYILIYTTIIIITNCILISQPHSYFKFAGDTSLVKNKDCSCFDDTYARIKSDINFKREGVVSSEFFEGFDFSGLDNYSVQELVDSINTIYPIIEYGVNFSKYMKPIENSKKENLETYYEIGGLNYTLYKNDSLVLYLTICLKDTDFYSILSKDFDENKETLKLMNNSKFCAYIRVHNINKQIIVIEKFEEETGELMHHNALIKYKKLKEKMRKISKEKNNE